MAKDTRSEKLRLPGDAASPRAPGAGPGSHPERASSAVFRLSNGSLPSPAALDWVILAVVMGDQPELACIHVVVHGRVQGVGFRASTEAEARRLELAGWVRNRADGAVEARFEGPPARVAEAVDWCHRGPSWARVERVETRVAQSEARSGFTIR